MVGVDSGSLQLDMQPKSFGLVLCRRPLGAVLHSSNEPGELSQLLCHDDTTINIGICIIIIITLLVSCATAVYENCPQNYKQCHVSFVSFQVSRCRECV